MRRLTLGDLPGTWASSHAQLAMQSTVRNNPKHALSIASERKAGSTWGQASIEDEDPDDGAYGRRYISTLEGIAALPWEEVNSRRQYDHLNRAMLPDCTYLAVTQEQLEEVFPEAKQSMWTLPYLLRKWHQDFTHEVFDTQYCRHEHVLRGMKQDGFRIVPSIKTGKPEMQCDAVKPTLVRDLWSPDDCYGAWMIIGPAEDENGDEIKGEQMIWTAYPGNLTPGVPSDWDGQLMSLLPAPYCQHIDLPKEEDWINVPAYWLSDCMEYSVKGVNNE